MVDADLIYVVQASLRWRHGGQDVWALGVISLCLGAGLCACTWYKASQPKEILQHLGKLLGVIDTTVWHRCKELPLWSLPYSIHWNVSRGIIRFLSIHVCRQGFRPVQAMCVYVPTLHSA